MPDQIACGIDFGTSNSTCAIADARGARLVPLEGDHVTLPSAIFFHSSGHILFGREATRAYVEGDDGRLMRGLKTILGTSLMEERTLVNSRTRSFTDILSIYIRNLKDKAEAFSERNIERVILGRPVHFHDNDPGADTKAHQILEDIAKSVGFKDVEFQYEPIAAAFSHEQNIEGEKLSLVIDLGGGTSDFTVIRLSEQRRGVADRASDVLATTGIRVGGTNFDKSLSLKTFMPFFGLGSEFRGRFDSDKILTVPLTVYSQLSDWAKVYQAQTPRSIRETKDILSTALAPEKIERLLMVQERQLGHALLHAVERTKIALTEKDRVPADVSDFNQSVRLFVTRKEFESAIKTDLQRIKMALDECLQQAGVTKEQIELVILTGGSTELPVVSRMVTTYFPEAQISSGHKFDSVGLGLAYQAFYNQS